MVRRCATTREWMMATEIIAEIGVNHQNDFDLGAALIRAAKSAGATAVKFQASVPGLEISRVHAPEHLAEIARLVPSFDMLTRWACVARDEGIEFLCTPAEETSLEFLVALGVRRIKIASDNLTNGPFLKACADTGLPLILSTGMADMDEVNWALNRSSAFGGVTQFGVTRGRVTLLHCVSAYPAPVDQMCLRAMVRMANYFGFPAGLSDHSDGILLAPVAVGMGAVMIEKHFTHDRAAPGPDHAASVEPMEFAKMVEAIRQVESALGDGQKVPQPCEAGGIRLYRKSIVAALPIARGTVFGPDNLAVKRPGDGLSPSSIDRLYGRHATRDYAADEQIGIAEVGE